MPQKQYRTFTKSEVIAHNKRAGYRHFSRSNLTLFQERTSDYRVRNIKHSDGTYTTFLISTRNGYVYEYKFASGDLYPRHDKSASDFRIATHGAWPPPHKY